ncbi:MAG: hydantoinase B/oxoprolinase family protein [Nitrospirales bacterium]|nr:hydantoinase B/oxoprolinase family protein [Nitrospira sp.]MDR4500616.1 hydantoinase B/oxoprolinase family protein [Nitrospirales bacterium]
MKHLFVSVAEEMGVCLQRAAYSPNIKERRDFSCAVFDAKGQLVAQAAHIPVHLGAMPLSVQACTQKLKLAPGDVAIVNDPYQGGTHLPDITMVSPVYAQTDGRETLVGFVANRAHHADVGGMSAGSMPLSEELYQEGVIIPPIKLLHAGVINQDVWDLFLANVRTPVERAGDLHAQLAANRIGIQRLGMFIERYGAESIGQDMEGLIEYGERMTRQLIADLPDGHYQFEDHLDDDGLTTDPVAIRAAVTIVGDEVTVDFTGSDSQRKGGVNAVYPITLSATMYVFRCLLGLDIPANSGCMKPVHVVAPEGTVVNARPPAAVAGGNVETSQRIVDVVLGALAQAIPARIPAASQGTMNNIAIGGWHAERRQPFAYYETIGGGMGASVSSDGASAIHSHMTNTLNTPVEALEYAYPFRVNRYEVRKESGGLGVHQGGDGLCREYEFLQDAHVTILSERRQRQPYGLAGGKPGKSGRNQLRHHGVTRELPGKCRLDVEVGDSLTIETPGGGGYGEKT